MFVCRSIHDKRQGSEVTEIGRKKVGVEALQSVSKNKPRDVLKIRDYPSLSRGFLSHFSSHSSFL